MLSQCALNGAYAPPGETTHASTAHRCPNLSCDICRAFRATLADDITVMFDSAMLPERQDGIVAVGKAFSRVFPPAGSRPSQLPPPLQPENLLVQDLGDVVIVSFHLRAPKEVARRTVVMQRTAAGWRVVHIDASSFELQS